MNVIAGRRKNFVYNNYARVSTDAGWKQNERRRKTRVVVRPRVLGILLRPHRTVSTENIIFFSPPRARPSISNRSNRSNCAGEGRWTVGWRSYVRNGAEKEMRTDSVPTTINIQLVPSRIAFRVQLYREMSPSRTGTHLFSQSRHRLTGISSSISVSILDSFFFSSKISFFFCYYIVIAI